MFLRNHNRPSQPVWVLNATLFDGKDDDSQVVYGFEPSFEQLIQPNLQKYTRICDDVKAFFYFQMFLQIMLCQIEGFLMHGAFGASLRLPKEKKCETRVFR